MQTPATELPAFEPTILRRMRIDRGITLRQECQALGYADPILSGIERRGRIAWPRLRLALAIFFGVPEADLFEPETGLARLATRPSTGGPESGHE